MKLQAIIHGLIKLRLEFVVYKQMYQCMGRGTETIFQGTLGLVESGDRSSTDFKPLAKWHILELWYFHDE